MLAVWGHQELRSLDIYSIYSIHTIYLQAGEEPGPALHHGGRARHLDLQQPQAEELRSHALETVAQMISRTVGGYCPITLDGADNLNQCKLPAKD